MQKGEKSTFIVRLVRVKLQTGDLHLILLILYSLYITRTYLFCIIIYLLVIYIYTPRQILLSAESKMLLLAVNGSEYRNARLLKMLRIRDDWMFIPKLVIYIRFLKAQGISQKVMWEKHKCGIYEEGLWNAIGYQNKCHHDCPASAYKGPTQDGGLTTVNHRQRRGITGP